MTLRKGTMILKKTLTKWSLQLFAEGEGAEGTASGEATSTAEDAVQQTEGAPAGESGVETRTPDEEFEDLINGQYKEQFQKRTQGIIDRRFKETKNLEAQIEKNKAINEAIAVKYGVDPTDIEALTKAVTDDSSLLEEAAYNENLTVEQYKEKLAGQRAQRELDAIKQQQREQQIQEQRAALAREIDRQQDEIRVKYNDKSFDFWKEYNTNPEFKGMFDARVPMETCYKVINQDRFIADAQRTAVHQTQKAVADTIMANGMRPVEGGIKTQPPVSSKVDVANVKSKEDIEKYWEMARQGKEVTFR